MKDLIKKNKDFLFKVIIVTVAVVFLGIIFGLVKIEGTREKTTLKDLAREDILECMKFCGTTTKEEARKDSCTYNCIRSRVKTDLEEFGIDIKDFQQP